MSKTGWIILGTIFVVIFGGAAGLLAVMMFHSVAPPPREEPQSLEREFEDSQTDRDEPGPRPAPELRGPDTPTDANMARRLAALEDQVKNLRTELAAERKKTKPMRDMYEEAKKDGMLPESGPGIELLAEPLSAGALAGTLAKDMGLEARRAKAFAETYDAWLEKAKRLEKEHAKVSVYGDTTTITIDRFGRDGEELRREWDDYVAGALSTDEKQAYDKQGARNRLVGSRGGDFARRIRIKQAGGSISITAEGEDATGNKTVEETQGPALARDLMLAD
ncbi:MAG: hypothetical protein P1V36_12865, partial [Planctomycetota bacterium]|nr:hypothetical protein [Planctomycetota bacterium]